MSMSVTAELTAEIKAAEARRHQERVQASTSLRIGLDKSLERLQRLELERLQRLEFLRATISNACQAVESQGFTVECPSDSIAANREGFRVVGENRNGHVCVLEGYLPKKDRICLKMEILGTTDPSCEPQLMSILDHIQRGLNQSLPQFGWQARVINKRWLTEREAKAHIHLGSRR